MDRVVVAVLVDGLVGLALLVVLWPTASAGRRFLRRWGVPEPDDRQSASAAGYLRAWRLLYPVLFLLTPVAAEVGARAFGFSPRDYGVTGALAPLLAALLIAEVVAALRPVRGTPGEVTVRRHWRDLVPRSAIVTLLSLTAVAVLSAAMGLAAQPWGDQVAASVPADGTWRSDDGTAVRSVSVEHYAEAGRPVSLVALVGAAVVLVAVLGVVRLAVRRGSVADPPVDAAFRTRSARVAVGIGIAWMALAVLVANRRLAYLRSLDLPPLSAPAWLEHTPVVDPLGLVVFLVGLAGWVLVATPPNRLSTARSAARG